MPLDEGLPQLKHKAWPLINDLLPYLRYVASVETNVTSGTETCSHLDESKIRPRTVKVRTPADQDWHEAKDRPRPGARINPGLGRIPGRPIAESEYRRPNRVK